MREKVQLTFRCVNFDVEIWTALQKNVCFARRSGHFVYDSNDVRSLPL